MDLKQNHIKNECYIIGAILLTLIALIIYMKPVENEEQVITVGAFSDSYWDVPNGYAHRILNDAIRIFEEEHPGYRVEYTDGLLKENYSEWLAEQLLEGAMPDVFFVMEEDFADFAQKGVLKNLDNLILKDETFAKDQFFSSAYSCGNYQSGQYALPFECAPELLFVNQSILKKEKLKVPEEGWDWESFYGLCHTVTKDTDGDGITDQFGECGYTWNMAFVSNDITVFNESGTGCSLTGEGVTQAINFLEKLEKLKGGYQTTNHDFAQGNIAFQPMSYSQYRAYKSYPLSVKKYSGFDWGCVPMPAGPSGTNRSFIDTLMIGMNKKSRNKTMAWEFMKILSCRKKIQEEIYTYSEGMPVLKEAAQNEEPLNQAVEAAVVRTRFRNYNELEEMVTRAVNDIISDDKNISMAQILWNRKINQWIDKTNSSLNQSLNQNMQ